MAHHDEPNWEDVRWDHGAADAAVGALRRAAFEIEIARGDDTRHAVGALAEWRGANHEQFEQHRRSAWAELGALAADCRAAAEGVLRASAEASEEQRRRERERAEWEREEERRRRSSVI